MKLIRNLFFIFVLSISINAKEEALNISFKDLSIMDLINITSKVIDRNILITQKINGNVDFISNKPLYKKDVVNILLYVLETKGFTLVDNENILRIVRLNESTKYNAPIIYGKSKKKYFQMVTEVFHVNNSNVDYVASKIRHLISKSAKLVTDKESNVIMLTDYKRNINTIKKVVKIITQDKRKVIEVVELKNVQSNDAQKTLTTIAKSVYNFKVEKDIVEILSNKENNAITIVGSRKNVKYLKSYILKIDKKGNITQRVVKVLSLKNVESKNVIKIINTIIDKKQYLDVNNKPHASSDEESNSIVLMGRKDEVSYIEELIEKLDIDKPQVYVQARIIEVNDDMVDEIGFKYNIFGSARSSSNLSAFSMGLNGGGDIIGDVSGLTGLAITDISSGLALGASIDLLKKNGALDIVSEPSILCINNKESSIYVGETVSIQTGTTTNDSGTSNSFEREDIGLTLKVKPRISSGNKVTLEINTILEDVKTTQTGGNPDTSKKEVLTTAIVNNGESVIIGGLIQNKEESTKQKVPLLGDIPLLGNLFKHESSDITKKSLVIIVTPYIVPKSKDLTFIRNQLAELKLLEDKYLQDALIRLKQKKIKAQESKKENSKKLKELDEELNEDFKPKKENSKMLTSDELHKQRVKEYFGI